MKKNIIGIFLISLGLLIGGFYLSEKYHLLKNYLPNQSSNVTPKFQFSSLPYILPAGFTMEVYSNLIQGPRDLESDGEKTIFVSVPAEGNVVALTDTAVSGTPEKPYPIITSLNYPHGLAYYNNKLFVAEENQVSRYDWNKKTFKATLEKVLFPLPGGGRHRTRSIVFDSAGKMYVSIGSTCDVCFENNPWLGSVVVSDFEGNNPHIYSTGLRNAVFMARNPLSGNVWVTEMGRDYLGDNLPPDEINVLQENGNYGWPLCYGNKQYDQSFGSQNNLNPSVASECQNTIAPIYNIPAHSAPLGLAFIAGNNFPSDYQGDLLVAYHGSWNRTVPDGYKVVRLSIVNGQVVSSTDFITGFLTNGFNIVGRPVDLLFGPQGNLFISDDKSNTIYTVKYIR